MPRRPVSDEERSQIVEAIRSGAARNDVARRFGRSPSTISKIAHAEGLAFDRAQTEAATKAKQADNRARRAAQAVVYLDKVDEIFTEIEAIRARLHGPTVVFNFGGRDNTYEERTLPEPDAATIRALTSSIRDLVMSARAAHTTVLDMERIDQPDAGHGALEQLIDAIGRARAQAS